MSDEARQQTEPNSAGDCFRQSQQGVHPVDNSILVHSAVLEPPGGAPGPVDIAEGSPRITRQIGVRVEDMFNHALCTEHRPANARYATSSWHVRLLITRTYCHVGIALGQIEHGVGYHDVDDD